MHNNRIFEFNEFKKLREGHEHQRIWEKEYRTQTKEMLLNELLDQQEKSYPLLNDNETKSKKKFQALIDVLEEKSQTPWLKQILKKLKENTLSQ